MQLTHARQSHLSILLCESVKLVQYKGEICGNLLRVLAVLTGMEQDRPEGREDKTGKMR